MTIHHDKLAYGKLAPESEELSDKQIEEMLKLLNGADEQLPESQKEEKKEKEK